MPAFFGNAFFVFLIRQYMRTIPRELDEAARIDGAGHLRIFWSVILPLCRAGACGVRVFVFLGSMERPAGTADLSRPQQPVHGRNRPRQRVTRRGTEWNLVMASNLMMMIPPIVIYFALQRRLIGGIASVGIKG